MAKTSLEKQIAKAQREAKNTAKKQAREAQKLAEKEARQQRAASIVNGQPIIEGLRIMDSTSEEMLKCLLEKSEIKAGSQRNFTDDIFPDYAKYSIALELEKLVQYGMISIITVWDSGGILNLLPQAVSYFGDKEVALRKQEERQAIFRAGSIVNYGNLIMGNANNSTFSIDNSVHKIEHEIEEKAGTDKEELLEILEEIKELMDNIETSRSIPKQKGLFKKLSTHMTKHGWFYAEIVALLGQQAIAMLEA